MSDTVQPEEITAERGGLVTMMNREMMVAFINRHLPETANLDVRTSYVYYDEDGDFKLALHNKLEGPGADVAFKRLGIKFWSKGIK